MPAATGDTGADGEAEGVATVPLDPPAPGKVGNGTGITGDGRDASLPPPADVAGSRPTPGKAEGDPGVRTGTGRIALLVGFDDEDEDAGVDTGVVGGSVAAPASAGLGVTVAAGADGA